MTQEMKHYKCNNKKNIIEVLNSLLVCFLHLVIPINYVKDSLAEDLWKVTLIS